MIYYSYYRLSEDLDLGSRMPEPAPTRSDINKQLKITFLPLLMN